MKNNQHNQNNKNNKKDLFQNLHVAACLIDLVSEKYTLQQAIANRQNSRAFSYSYSTTGDESISPYAKALCYPVLRYYLVLEELINCFLPEPKQKQQTKSKIDTHVKHLLMLAFVLLIKKPQFHQNFAILDQTLNAAKLHKKSAFASGFINAILRTYLRAINHINSNINLNNNIEDNINNKDSESSEKHPRFEAFYQKHPEFFNEFKLNAKQIYQQLPKTWQKAFLYKNKLDELAQASLVHTQGHPPLYIRVNPTKYSPTAYLKILADAGIEANLTSFILPALNNNDNQNDNQSDNQSDNSEAELNLTPYAIKISNEGVDITQLPKFSDGAFAVQDLAAQIVPQLLNLKNGLRVLDACSAPGGKIFSCLEQYRLHVDLIELDEKRAEKIQQNYLRLDLKKQAMSYGLHLQSVEAFVLEHLNQPQQNGYDRIILDAPCSCSGVLRKHPEMLFSRLDDGLSPDDLAAKQMQMLRELWPLLKPAGLLVYVTCSIFKSEGLGLIEEFLAKNTDARLLPSPLHIYPSTEHDGFFYALLQKN